MMVRTLYTVHCTAGKLVTTVVVCKILNRETPLEYTV